MKYIDKKLKEIYDEFAIMYTLYKIEQEALYLCYEENLEYGHIFSLDTIFKERFERNLKKFSVIISE